ncbi:MULTISPECIES: hypothetical protein [Streptomyces]|uniref:Uncharacterized protein n=1 Tax=Streptomyces katrae TaxID=68223 RepID=A0ABT7H7E3_9ACTN|nr:MULTISPECIES: hypothetical protein [Streptomyces]MDK9500989.1 hypothetical protein [Streptomyces katrae]RST02123.1 hypothetical protein EF910_24840 [Streptomyces sp. WAC07149]GLX18470.1 hypothetical protein Slala01_21140 [Streptomyces lavendulae subsp. lavendulae]GLX28605.1 hypothetical protein Slala02_44250 [Streptomyces lavendulae subsp. lavendulae]
MDGWLLPLSIALIGMTGTLFAPLLTQRLVGRVQSEQFERQERMAEGQWQREQRAAELDVRRACYVAAMAGYRRYRIELMNFLWLAHKARAAGAAGGGAGERTGERAAGRADLEAARQAMHLAFAEAQLVGSEAVVAELDATAERLAEAFYRVLRLDEGDPAPDGDFEAIKADLLGLGERWREMRAVMRADLGTDARLQRGR